LVKYAAVLNYGYSSLFFQVLVHFGIPVRIGSRLTVAAKQFRPGEGAGGGLSRQLKDGLQYLGQVGAFAFCFFLRLVAVGYYGVKPEIRAKP